MEELRIQIEALEANSSRTAAENKELAKLQKQLADMEAAVAAAVANAANAALTVDTEYSMTVSGFTYIRDFAVIRGRVNGNNESCIIGDKLSFPMSDMFMLRQAGNIKVMYKGEKVVNGKTYNQFWLMEIGF